MMTSSQPDDAAFWSAYWDDDNLPWHADAVHPNLKDNLDLFLGDLEDRKTIFVPLCGKSLDLIFLYMLGGHQVVGCEIVEKACIQTFEEAKLDFVKEEQNGIKVFRSCNGRLKIFCCNFFDLTPSLLDSKIDCVWDRGGLVAVDPNRIANYVQVLKSLVAEDFRILLSAFEFKEGQEDKGGPPNAISYEKAKELFGDFSSIKVLEHRSEVIPPGLLRPPFMKINLFMMSAKGINDKVDYWQNRWTGGTAKWHTNDPQPLFVKHVDKLLGTKGKMRIFLPLCGKAGDLPWLYNLGHEIIGIEGVPYVVEELFAEQNIKFSKKDVPEINGFLYESEDKRLKIYTCDFYQFKPDLISPVDTVFDRGSFEAIDEADRSAYVDLMFKILGKSFKMLLNGYIYDNSVFKGPPKYVDPKVVYDLYGSHGANIEIVEEVDMPEKAKQYGIQEMKKVLYLVTR